MVTETIVGEFFVFCAGASVVGKRVDADAAAGREESGDLNVFGGHKADEVFHDDIDAVFVEVAVVSETEEIEFQAFAFDHALVGEIGDTNFGKIGLSGDGTEAGELRAVETNPVVVLGMFVLESLEHLGGIVGLILGLLAESLELKIFAHDFYGISGSWN